MYIDKNLLIVVDECTTVSPHSWIPTGRRLLVRYDAAVFKTGRGYNLKPVSPPNTMYRTQVQNTYCTVHTYLTHVLNTYLTKLVRLLRWAAGGGKFSESL